MKTHLPLVFALSSLLSIPLPDARGDAPYAPEYIQGNTFRYTGSSSYDVTTTQGAYLRFTATENTSATSLHLYLNSDTSSMASSLTYGLQADNGNGAPSGVFLASSTIAPTVGWNSITFAGQPLLAGQVYHVVALPAVGGRARLRRLAMPEALTSQTYGVVDTQYAYGSITGGTAGAPSNDSAVNFVVGTTSAQSFGLAYYNTTSPLLSATVPYAQRFRFTASEPGHTVLDSISVRLSATEEDTPDVRITLLNDANVVLATTVLDSGSITPSATGNYTVTFDDSPILTDGGYYRLALNLAEEGARPIRWVADITGSTSDAINSATFQGLDGYTFSYSDASFVTPQSIAYGNDFIFSYTATAIPEPGTAALLIAAFALTGRMLRRKRA